MILVKTAVLVLTAVMATMTAVPGKTVGVTVSTVVAAGMAVVSADSAESAVIMITNRTSLIL